MRDFAQDIKALTLNTATLGHNLDGHGAGWGVERGTQGVRESLKIVTERLQQALVVAADRGVKLALEPLNPVYAGNRSCLTTLRDALDICDALGSDNLGVAVDVYPMVGHRSFAAVAAGGGGADFGLSPVRLAGGYKRCAAGPGNDGRRRRGFAGDSGQCRSGGLSRCLRGRGGFGGKLVETPAG